MDNLSGNFLQVTSQVKPQWLSEIKNCQKQPQSTIQFDQVFRFNVDKVKTYQNDNIQKRHTILHPIPKHTKPSQSNPTSIEAPQQVSNIRNQIVEENYAKSNTNPQPQFNQFSTIDWLLPRHPNSLFKIIPIKQKFQRKNPSTKLTYKITPSCKSNQTDKQVQLKSTEVKCENGVKNQPKKKLIHKNPNFKPRKGKNQQPMAQKLIKKLSGFHYNKNYKQNRNKTLKKLTKRGLKINLSNFSEYIGKLKLEINKKFTKPDMKIKTNTKGEQVNPKKFYDLYHSHFPQPGQREFVERLYNEVFKRVYVIMWKSDQRLKRIDTIKIEGVEYGAVQTDPSSEVKIQHKEMDQEKDPMTDSKAEDRRAVFVQCLDDEGKMELDRVFDEEYDRFYSKFEWLPINEKESVPERESLKKRIEKFCWIEE